MAKWEDMELDCLCLVFSKLDLSDLLTSIPFVCKSWYQVSSQPFFYHTLDFHSLNLCASAKLAMARSQGAVFDLCFPSYFPFLMKALTFASIACPNLKTLRIPQIIYEDETLFFNLLSKWKNLEWLEIESKPVGLRAMTEQIGNHCKKFCGLKLRGMIGKEDASGIADLLPSIKILDLSGSRIEKEEVLAILDGCKELKRLCLNNCIGFEAEEDVKMKARGLDAFEVENCRDDGLRNFANQTHDLEQMFMHFDDCIELWMF